MPCMCGDICCPSCGPAQGNHKCPVCGNWASDGCVHFTTEQLKTLIGKTVTAASYNPEHEGSFLLTFNDNSSAEFSSTGDDATYTTLEIVK